MSISLNGIQIRGVTFSINNVSGPNWPEVYDDFDRGNTLLSLSPTPTVGPADWGTFISEIALLSSNSGESTRDDPAGDTAQAVIPLGLLTPTTGVRLEFEITSLSLTGELGTQTSAPIGVSLLLYGENSGAYLELSAISTFDLATPVGANWTIGMYSDDGSQQQELAAISGNLPFTAKVEMELDGSAQLFINNVPVGPPIAISLIGLPEDTYTLTFTFPNGSGASVTDSVGSVNLVEFTPPALFFEDTFDGAAGSLAGHAPTSGYPIAAYGFGTWVDEAGDPQLDGAGGVIFNPTDSASIASTGDITYANNPGGYVISLYLSPDLGDLDSLIELEGVLPNGIQYLITVAFTDYTGTDPSTVTVQYGPSLEFGMQTGIITVYPSINVFLGNTAQSIEVNSVEEATATESITFGSSNTVSLLLYAGVASGSVTVENVQIDTL